MMEKTCCFTGHRRIPAEYYEKIESTAKFYMELLIKEGIEKFIAGGAVGFDFLCASAILELREKYPHIQLEMAVPSPDYAKFFPYDMKLKYREIFKKADRITLVSERYTPSCMHLRNKYMVDHSSVLICFCTQTYGGSFFTRKYALSKKLKIYDVFL